MTQWLCVSGPIHGEYRPAGRVPIAVTDPGGKVDYITAHTGTSEAWEIKVAVAVPPRPAIYYAQRIRLPGWRVTLMAWVEAGAAAGTRELEDGLVFPGGIQGTPMGWSARACRWCYGRPMEGLDVCSRSSCITRYAWLESLDAAFASDAEGWHGDRS